MSYLNQCSRRILIQNGKGNVISTLFRSTYVQCNPSIALLNQMNCNQQRSQMITSFTPNKDNNTSMFNQSIRMMSTKEDSKSPESSEEETTKTAEKEAEEKEETDDQQQPEPLTKEEKLEAEIKKLKDNLLRSLAEQENTRRIAKRDVESARQYAITSFAKSLYIY